LFECGWCERCFFAARSETLPAETDGAVHVDEDEEWSP
jgi:hypothetical protein